MPTERTRGARSARRRAETRSGRPRTFLGRRSRFADEDEQLGGFADLVVPRCALAVVAQDLEFSRESLRLERAVVPAVGQLGGVTQRKLLAPPPIQIGGWGPWTGWARRRRPRGRYRGSRPGGCTSRSSRVPAGSRRSRRAGGPFGRRLPKLVAKAIVLGFVPAAAQPSSSRPSLTRSTVAAIFASSAGWR